MATGQPWLGWAMRGPPYFPNRQMRGIMGHQGREDFRPKRQN